MVPAIPQTSLVDEIPQLEANIPAEQFAATPVWIMIVSISGAILLLCGVGVWWYWRSKHKTPPLPPSPLAICTAQLDELEENLPPMRECSIRLSLIIREFLAGQAQDSSLFETHEEFSQRIDSLATLPASCRLETQSLLNALAEFKYTGIDENNTTMAQAFIGQTRSLFQRIITEQQKEAELKKQIAAKAP